MTSNSTTETMEPIPLWFLPSFHGDIRLEAEGKTKCRLITTELTPSEKDAIGRLEVLARKKEWISGLGHLNLTGTSSLSASIEKVAGTLGKLMKPGRTIISAVKFTDGTMEEIRTASPPVQKTSGDPTTDPVEAPQPYRTEGDVLLSEKEWEEKKKRRLPKKKPRAAVSTAAPVRGCPPPDFDQAEIRARRVLAEFLTVEQLADFQKHNKFISIGATTGNRFMITSRLARDQLTKYTRTLYDLDRKMPLCVHDYEVPPAEEMLGLHILLQLPGWEAYLCGATEDNLEDVLRQHIDRAARDPLTGLHEETGDPLGIPELGIP
jgi:hypothetical protein